MDLQGSGVKEVFLCVAKPYTAFNKELFVYGIKQTNKTHHYENMPIQIYRNFTTKKWKFSDKKF